MKKLIRSAQIGQDPRFLMLQEYAVAEETVLPQPEAEAIADDFEGASDIEAGAEAELTDPETEVEALQPADDEPVESEPWQAPEALEQEYREKKQAEIAQAREQAKTEGYEEGYEAGIAAGKMEYADATQQLRQLLGSAVDTQNDNIGALEDIAIEIVFEAVTKILGERLVTVEGVAACVREVIRHAEQNAHMVLHVSPTDYRLLTGDDVEPICSNDGQEIEIRPDERVDLGGCLLETGGGSLDGRLEVQLKQLKETLLLARSHPSGVEPE